MEDIRLPDLWAKSKERPDIIVYTDGTKTKVVVVAEVRSSSMVYTERKATFALYSDCYAVPTTKYKKL